MSEYYTVSGWPATRAALASAPARSEMNLISAGFDKMPTLSGNANKPVFVNGSANGLTSVTASAARANLGLEIGVDVQAEDAGLTSIAGLTTAADRMIYTTASDTYAVATLTSAGRALLDDASAAAQLITLGLTATASELNALDGITSTVTELNYTDGVTSAIQTQLNAKQPLDADLTAIAALANTDGNFIVGNGSTFVAESGADARASLGISMVYGLTDTTISRSSTTTLVADTVLAGYTLEDGASYEIEGLINFTATASTGDAKFDFGFNSTVVAGRYSYYGTDSSGLASASVAISDFTADQSLTINNTLMALFIKGAFTVTGGAGTLDFRWAQNVSNASATYRNSGSYIKLTKIVDFV